MNLAIVFLVLQFPGHPKILCDCLPDPIAIAYAKSTFIAKGKIFRTEYLFAEKKTEFNGEVILEKIPYNLEYVLVTRMYKSTPEKSDTITLVSSNLVQGDCNIRLMSDAEYIFYGSNRGYVIDELKPLSRYPTYYTDICYRTTSNVLIEEYLLLHFLKSRR